MYTRLPVEVFAADGGHLHMENQYSYRAVVFIRAELLRVYEFWPLRGIFIMTSLLLYTTMYLDKLN